MGLLSDFIADFPEWASCCPVVSDLQDIYPEQVSPNFVLFKPASGLDNHIDRLVLVSWFMKWVHYKAN